MVGCASVLAALGCGADTNGRPPSEDDRRSNGPSACPDYDNPSLSVCCDSPWKGRYQNIAVEDYACADKCNYHFDRYDDANPPYYDYQSADLCDDVFSFHFDDLAMVHDDAKECGSSFNVEDVEACYNDDLPPEPSIRRSLLKPERSHWDGGQTSTQTLKPWGAERSTPGQYFAVPSHRTSTDGRIATVSDTQLAVLHPENADYGSQVSTDASRPIRGYRGSIGTWARVSPDSSNTRYPRAMLDDDSASEHEYNLDLCSANGVESTDNPQFCRARNEEGDALVDGDCYDQTIIYSNRNVGADGRYWELRSLDVVLFVPHGKEAQVQPWAQRIRVFPRSAVTDYMELPAYEHYDYNKQIADYGTGSDRWSSTSLLAERWDDDCAKGSSEPWCAFISDQKAIAPSAHYSMEGFGDWDGRTFEQALLEPTTTADGMVIVIHNVNGIFYSYNTQGPCDASGWREFKSIASAYQDPDVNTRYGFARNPIRDTRGETFASGTPVPGGYPWIDRAGDNIMFPAAESIAGFKVRWNEDLAWTQDDGSYSFSAGELAQFEDFNHANARGVVVVGSWTGGKEVLVDGGVNLTDWESPLFNADPGTMRLQMYEESRTVFRNIGTARLSSLENQLNGFDAWTPISPFDVVWMVGSSYEHNTELVFDEYMHEDALVVAHMNAQLKPYSTVDGDLAYHDDNGFECPGSDIESTSCAFRGTPVLQNAATVSSPATLRLLGGAWVPPVAEGGVKGKGIFLDGTNDHIEVTGLTGGGDGYYLGMWVDLRRGFQNVHEVLYSLGDDAYVGIAGGEMVFVRGDDEVEVELPDVVRDQYVHIGLAIYPSTVDVYINGTHSGFAPIEMPSLPSTMHIGMHEENSYFNRPVRAWVDEFRVYRLHDEDHYESHQLEAFCNHALGSLDDDVCSQIDVWAARDTGDDGLDSGLDFPAQAYAVQSCGNSVHRNHGNGCDRGDLLEIDGANLVADLPRPDLSDNAFCKTCHEDGHTVQGLGMGALTAGTGPYIDDERRQPMSWPRELFGTLPTIDGNEVITGAGTGSDGALLDEFLLGNSPSQGPTRIEP